MNSFIGTYAPLDFAVWHLARRVAAQTRESADCTPLAKKGKERAAAKLSQEKRSVRKHNIILAIF